MKVKDLEGNVYDLITNQILNVGLNPNQFYFALKLVNKDLQSPMYNRKRGHRRNDYPRPLTYKVGKTVRVKEIDTDVREDCGKGINLGTFNFCKDEQNGECERAVVVRFKGSSAIVPKGYYGESYEKIRVKQCVVMGEIETSRKDKWTNLYIGAAVV